MWCATRSDFDCFWRLPEYEFGIFETKSANSRKIQAEIKTSYQEIDNLRKEMLDEYEKHGESAEYGLKSRQIQEKEVLRADLEERLLKINNHEYDGVKNETMGRSVPLFIGGILVIVVSLVISGVLFSIEQKKK